MASIDGPISSSPWPREPSARPAPSGGSSEPPAAACCPSAPSTCASSASCMHVARGAEHRRGALGAGHPPPYLGAALSGRHERRAPAGAAGGAAGGALLDARHDVPARLAPPRRGWSRRRGRGRRARRWCAPPAAPSAASRCGSARAGPWIWGFRESTSMKYRRKKLSKRASNGGGAPGRLQPAGRVGGAPSHRTARQALPPWPAPRSPRGLGFRV